MRRRFQVGLLALTLLGFFLLAPGVHAEEASLGKDIVQKVEEHNRKGIEYYKAGKLPEAVQEMLEAYHLIPSNDLLYNIARIYQKMGEEGLALKYFQDYVTSPGVKPANVKKALEKMAEIRESQNQKKRLELIPSSPPPQAPKAVVPAPAPEPIPQAEPEVAPPIKATDISEAAPVKSDPIPTEWIVGGAGGALVVFGAGFGLAASSAFGDFEKATSDSDKLDAQKRTEKWSTFADLSYALGIGAIAGAVVWKYVIAEKEPVAVRVAPTILNGGFGMVVTLPLFDSRDRD